MNAPASARGGRHPPLMATVSWELMLDLLRSIQRISTPSELRQYLAWAGLPEITEEQAQLRRVSHHQIVHLYKVAAVGTGDEMMGLWSRPIRSGALKYICRNLIDSPNLERALYRFCRIWNLLLDDYELVLVRDAGEVAVELRPRLPLSEINRFGHMLLLKLIHGIASWLVGRELPCAGIAFKFVRPPFAADYPILFPAQIAFDAPRSSIRFSAETVALPVVRPPSEIQGFLERAPQEWLYTGMKEHAVQLKVREFLLGANSVDASLSHAARHLNVTSRTLLRRLAAENLTFQGIKDDLRRDMAIHELEWTAKSIDEVSCDLGFSSAAVFHRAFKKWTGMTPGRYRRGEPAKSE